jgi:tRNA pseudouridine55 synthase
VYSFEQLWRQPGPDGAPQAAFAIECASGTYVRSLIADLGDAYCVALRRTAIGPFRVVDASPPPARGSTWADPPLIAPADALALAREAERPPARGRQ